MKKKSLDSINILMPVLEKYPGMNITQLGMVSLYLGAIRAGMGHESAASTVRDYIHKEGLSADVSLCVEFLEREVLSLKKSRIDIDQWKIGNKKSSRPE